MRSFQRSLLPCLFLLSILFLNGCGGPVLSASSPPVDYSVSSVCMQIHSEDDLAELERYSSLHTADLCGSSEELVQAYIQSHPQVSVRYDVPLTSMGSTIYYPNDITDIELEDADLIYSFTEKSDCFSSLNMIKISDPSVTVSQYELLKSCFPRAFIFYYISDEIGSILPESSALDLCMLKPEEFSAARGFLEAMPNLVYVRLTDENGSNLLPIENAVELVSALPLADIDYRIDLFGQNVSVSATQLIYDLVPIGNEGANELREKLTWFPRLSYLRLEQCGIDSAVLDELNHDFPDIDVVWRIFFSAYSCLTDVTKILASGSVEDKDTADLQYCHRVKYIDLGHNNITNIDFVWGMPEIEVAIFAGTKLANIDPLVNCPKLEYLEIFGTNVNDISPLASCTLLEHFNFSYMNGLADVSVLLELPNLQRIWCGHNINKVLKQVQQYKQLYPDCEISLYNEAPTGDGWRYEKDKVTRVPRYELLAQQFGYDEKAYSWW